MVASLSDNTVKQYNSSYRLWWTFCKSQNINPFNSSLSPVMHFLSEQFNKGCSYGSLNTHRSALSLLLGDNIGSDEQIKRLLKGAYRLKPSNPKYTQTWDPQLVLNHVSEWFPNISLTLDKLTKKLVCLLALCTAHRVQTLSIIRLENISFTERGAKIIITDLIKTSAPGREPPVMLLPYFTENVNICPATTLKDYISVTENKRVENRGRLLLTHKAPHKPASTQSISRWIKLVLSESGIDASTFSAHSTRHAATSAACCAGLSVETIRKAAGWTPTSNVFARFYNRVIVDDGDFARSVCLSNNDH